jgi:DNA-binding response OmpR family regulator
MIPPAPTVLVVDDTPATAQSLADFLRADGFVVRVATSTADALAALSGCTPDAAIVDVDGPARANPITAALAGLDRRPLMIAILRPGAASLSRQELAQFDYAYTKAVSPAVLAERISAYLAKKTIRCEG